MKIHPVLLEDGRITADRKCSFCHGHGVYDNELCYCLSMYYGQPLARATVEQLKAKLKQFQAEDKHASRRMS